MSYNHRRPPSPRLSNPGRVSDNSIADPYFSQRHNSYVSPRSSGVIPISTQTFVNVPPPSTIATPNSATTSRAEPRYDSYSGRPRRSSIVDDGRGSASTLQLPSRSKANVVQQNLGRPASPSKPGHPAQPSREYYVLPASSQEPRTSVSTHKKLYSVDDGAAKLVADVNIPGQAGRERQHKRRDSVERSGYRVAGVERDRGTRSYHTTGAYTRPKDKSIEDEDAYSYTDPASMYKDTEPRWREPRQRRGSMDRTGTVSRERPISMLEPAKSAKEVGPPPSTRGWDKINDIGRTRSVRDGPREVAQSPTRGRSNREAAAYLDPRDTYYVPPRVSSTDRRTTTNDNVLYENELREPRRPERRHSVNRDTRADKSVERRGFGIRPDFRNESQTGHSGRDGRGSDESFDQARHREPQYAEPHRRETVPSFSQQDISRLEQEKWDRETVQRPQDEEYSRIRHRGHSDAREYSQEPRRRDDDRTYDREYDRAQERDRDQERNGSRVDYPPDRERERHHHRRDTDRERDYNRKESSPKQSGENVGKTGLAQAATGGLATAAAAFGLSNLLNKKSDKRDKDDYQDRDRERDREKERPADGDRERQRSDRKERRSVEERENLREVRQVASDEAPRERAQRDHYRDEPNEPGLGFAFEAPQPSRNAPPNGTERTEDRHHEWSQSSQDKQIPDHTQEREGRNDSEKGRSSDTQPHEHSQVVDMPAPALDPVEDYRRRMEQVQRELGRTSEDQRASDSDADRERRRREREQRQRERDSRHGNSTASAESSFDNPYQSPRDDMSTYASTVGTDLKRKPSILDRPMTDEPGQMAQIIDNTDSDKRENRVRIVDPPTEEEDRRPKGILKKPTQKFPDHPDTIREGVAPHKDATKKGIPPGARWTKIDRRLVNPEALEQAQERFEERLDCVIVLRVLTKEEIQKLADKTRALRDHRFDDERSEHKSSRRRDRRDRDEYEFSDSEDEFKQKAPKMLEAPQAPPSAVSSNNNTDFSRDHRDRRSERDRDSEANYMSGGLGRREEQSTRY